MASQFHNLAVKLTDLLLNGIARFEQRSDRSYQLRAALEHADAREPVRRLGVGGEG